MVQLPHTSSSIEQYEASAIKRTGLHTLQKQATTVGGIDIGSVDFDPVKHMPHQIDPLSPMTEVEGIQQVRLQHPKTPLIMSVIEDIREKSDDRRIAEYKAGAVKSIASGMNNAALALDSISNYHLTGEDFESDESALISEICTDGLSIVISDFRNMRFEGKKFSERGDVVAVKVNHPLERFIIPNVGRLPLGGLVEVNTNDPDQVDYLNNQLEEEHQSIVSDLEKAGALVVPVIVDPNTSEFVSPTEIDEAMAETIKSLS